MHHIKYYKIIYNYTFYNDMYCMQILTHSVNQEMDYCKVELNFSACMMSV